MNKKMILILISLLLCGVFTFLLGQYLANNTEISFFKKDTSKTNEVKKEIEKPGEFTLLDRAIMFPGETVEKIIKDVPELKTKVRCGDGMCSLLSKTDNSNVLTNYPHVGYSKLSYTLGQCEQLYTYPDESGFVKNGENLLAIYPCKVATVNGYLGSFVTNTNNSNYVTLAELKTVFPDLKRSICETAGQEGGEGEDTSCLTAKYNNKNVYIYEMDWQLDEEVFLNSTIQISLNPDYITLPPNFDLDF